MIWLLTTIGAALVSLVCAGLTGPAQTFFARHANRIKQARALARLETMYREGDRIKHLYAYTGAGVKDFGGWQIQDMAMGRVVLTRSSGANHDYWVMTGQEFEKMHVILTAPKC